MAKNFEAPFKSNFEVKPLSRKSNVPDLEEVSVNYRTTHYEWFDASDPANRDLDQGNLRSLIKSFTKKVLDIPIIVTKAPGKKEGTEGWLLVRDGQHRLFVCQKLGIPIFYTIAKNFKKDDVSLANSASKTWNSTDHLNKFVEDNNENYKNFKKITEGYPNWEMYIFFDLLNKREGEKSTNAQSFKNGELSLKNSELNEIQKKIRTLARFEDFKKSGHTRRYLFGAILNLLHVDNFDHNRLYNKLEKNIHMLQSHDRSSALISLIDMYNKGLQTGPGSGRISYMHNRKDIVNIVVE